MKHKEESINNPEVSKQIENSLDILILYRSLYIIKQKFSLFKERIKKIYDKYNIYNNNYKLNTDIKIYQIDKNNFVTVVDEVLKDLNLLIIKYSNPKDIFFSKVMLENKIKESFSIIQEILNWLISKNNGKYSIKHYNKLFFNKKIKQYLQEGENVIITESDSNTNTNINKDDNSYYNLKNGNDNDNDDFSRNLSKRDYVNVCEYNRKGILIKKDISKILDENEESGEGVIETIDTNKKIAEDNNNDPVINKELSINLNNIDESKNTNRNSNSNINLNMNKKSQDQNQIILNNDFIFIESLPLILADFLEAHLTYAIIESEDELGKELKVLFDNELLKRINEFNNVLKDKSSLLNDISTHNLSKDEKIKSDLENALEDLKKIRDNIKIYKDILENKKKLNEDVGYIEKMIEKLYAKEIWLEHRIKLLYEKDKNNLNNNANSTNNLNITNNIGRVTGNTCMSDLSYIGTLETNKNLTNNNRNLIYMNTNTNKQLNESITNSINTGIINDKSNNTSITTNSSKLKINKALQDIFIHYSKQHNIAGYTPLFSTVQQKQFHLDLQEFSKFCIDFRIPILRQKIVEIFKKSVSNLHIMTFKEFKNSLINLANSVHESKKKIITEKINSKKNELNSLELKEKQIKEEKKLKRLLYDNNDELMNMNNNNYNNISTTNISKSKLNNNKNGKNRSSSSKANIVLQKKTIFNDIANYKINYNKENKKNYQEIVDDFYEFLGLYSTQDYRSKMRGYNMSPIKTASNLINQEKSFLSGEGNRSRSFKKEDMEEINKMIENKNEKIKKQMLDKEKSKLLLYKEKIKLFNINNQRLKLTVDKKMKKKTYLDLMKEQQEEKSELLLMQQQQEKYLKNKVKEKELQKSKEKERLKELKNMNNISCKNEEESKDIEIKSKDITRIEEKHKHLLENSNTTSNININISNNDSEKNKIINEKEIEQINNTNMINSEIIKKEEEDENKKRNDKNQIWWEKLEKYDINDLGMNEEEKDIFINSDNSEDNDIVSKITKSKQNSNNNSFGGLILDNSIQKSSSIIDLRKANTSGPIQLPPITVKKSILKNKNNVIELPLHNDKTNNNFNHNYNYNLSDVNTNLSQNKRTGLYEIQNRIKNGNNNKINVNVNDNNRYKNMIKNNSSGLLKNNQISQSEKSLKYIKKK